MSTTIAQLNTIIASSKKACTIMLEGMKYNIDSIEHARELFKAYRSGANKREDILGMSDMRATDGRLTIGGVVYFMSYNTRVWHYEKATKSLGSEVIAS